MGNHEEVEDNRRRTVSHDPGSTLSIEFIQSLNQKKIQEFLDKMLEVERAVYFGEGKHEVAYMVYRMLSTTRNHWQSYRNLFQTPMVQECRRKRHAGNWAHPRSQPRTCGVSRKGCNRREVGWKWTP